MNSAIAVPMNSANCSTPSATMRDASERSRRGRAGAGAGMSALARGEHVADAADRLEQARVARILLDLLAQARHHDIDRAIECLVRGAVHELQQLLAPEDAASALG